MAVQSADNQENLAAVLERFLCPGGKLRLSPYVEAMQCSVLFGERPDPGRHAASLRELLATPRHADRLNAIARDFPQEDAEARF